MATVCRVRTWYIQAQLISTGEQGITTFLRPVDGERVVYRCGSFNNGKSWSRIFPSDRWCPFSGIAAGQCEDRFFLLHNHTDQHKRSPLNISVSEDQGISWQQAYKLDGQDLG